MKILQINVTANSGSTGRIAEGIGKTAMDAGHESWVAYGRFANPSTSRLIRIASRWNCLEHGIESRLFDNHGLASRSATRAFLKQVDDIRPDIIHLHNIHGYYLNYKILFNYLKKLNVPVVWTLHDCWPFTGHCTYFTACSCDKWKKGCFSCPQKKSYPASFFWDRASKNYEEKKLCYNSISNLTIVSVSHWLDNLVSHSFLKKHNHIVIHNGIDTDLFTPSSNAKQIRKKHGIIDDETMLLGVASTWDERKGLCDFIELSNRLPPQKKIILIGLNKKQIYSLPHNIIGVERTESMQEMAEYYSAADIVLNLSKEETFGMTTIEGFACGTPVIGYNNTATPELITCKTGLIVQEKRMDQLINAIDNIASQGKEHFSTFCRQQAVTCYNQNSVFSKYLDLYNTLFCSEQKL